MQQWQWVWPRRAINFNPVVWSGRIPKSWDAAGEDFKESWRVDDGCVGGDDGINDFWLRYNGNVLQILESEAESN